MVGTAVYQVDRVSASHAPNFKALKPGVAKIDAPAAMLDSTAAISPWIWKSGMMLRQRSAGVSAKVVRMWLAEAAILA